MKKDEKNGEGKGGEEGWGNEIVKLESVEKGKKREEMNGKSVDLM